MTRTLFASQTDLDEERQDDVDFKMVTFSLGGKEYGIDIMRVKEIAKFESFTYVPNTQPFVSGVYNLRGDIISVIDMRVMFNLPAEQRSNSDTQDGLILRLESGLIGVIVDQIDKVVGISSQSIQPPHPIFADINIKYISGVVEHDDRLYIILDAERILGETQTEEDESAAPAIIGDQPAEPSEPQTGAGEAADVENIAQTLQTLNGFIVSDLNRDWVANRLNDWRREGDSIAITTQDEADAFLAPFFSPYSGRFWEGTYLEKAREIFPSGATGNIGVWNPGCGKGYESYSIAAILAMDNPDARVKVWASDSDLIHISTAPNLVVDERAVPAIYRELLVEGTDGYTFQEDVRTSILFEFTDVANIKSLPPAEIIVMRDVLSFVSSRDQQRILSLISEQATEATRIVVGNNENLAAIGTFTEISNTPVRVFTVR